MAEIEPVNEVPGQTAPAGKPVALKVKLPDPTTSTHIELLITTPHKSVATSL